MACAWSREKVVEVLALKIALAAMNGKASPVAAKVLARLEAK